MPGAYVEAPSGGRGIDVRHLPYRSGAGYVDAGRVTGSKRPGDWV